MHAEKELLIASVTPQNLERGVLWWSENREAVKKASVGHLWWQNNIIFIEESLVIKPSELVRRMADMGYERTQTVGGKGLMSVRGGIIEIWPVNTETPYLIEFDGNVISQILPRPKIEERSKPKLSQNQGIEKLPAGSYVVHIDHGIGIFQGIQSAVENSSQHFLDDRQKIVDSNTSSFFKIEYASPGAGREPDILYVPVDQKDRLSPYVGFETPHIHRLGGSVWEKTKRKVKEETEKLARELLALYAKRHIVERAPYMGDAGLEEEVISRFPFQETPDQIKAEEEIMADLARPQPMDRILCGDVGFGKTEIAIRASLRVIASGKQVVLLAPTTVLAAQHERTLKERFADTAISVGMLSRLTPKHDEKKILHGLAAGTMDFVVGTHRLLSKDITIKNLGLVIIDEEQRFGVKQKEILKGLRLGAGLAENKPAQSPSDQPQTIETPHGVDVLSLSATPIPRTMQLTLARVRDISFLKTPPPDRLAIHTFVLPYTQKTIAEAMRAELERGGQIYFLHNRIETIGAVKQKLEKLLTRTASSKHFSDDRQKIVKMKKHPRIGVMHGRMQEGEMIKVMNEFRNREIDILLATTIIENGLDISSANTLIVDDATLIGLAEAHQLRGRVGRSSNQAFAYFLYKPRHMTEKAADRLQALQDYADLGSGYDIALRDLEIRGAGNILGREQSGTINKIGLNLYYQMLADAIEDIKTEHNL
ncbi:MAG: DEAD/DEAH box helicase [Candidatus Sungbacteria bacterium]|nr:DEAD/DEAH box helicase [Candidatus Sungbacteria bacterium]